MPGPLKKDPSLVNRRNKPPAREVLKATKNPKIPPLPSHIKSWYAPVREWWKRSWSSPMAAKWAESDRDAMYLAAVLWQQFWDPETSPSTRNQTSAQIRAILDQCGLSPMSRHRLGWELESPDSADKPGTAKKSPPVKKAAPTKDPRQRRLHAVPAVG